ncbi:MAG: hypothetical protein ACLFU2_06215, partial [Opitutales bacterium]
ARDAPGGPPVHPDSGGNEPLRSFGSESVVVRDRASGEVLPSTVAYCFAWQAFYPETALWQR